MIKIFTLLTAIIFSFSAFAETTTKIVFKIINAQSVETSEGTYMQVEADIVTKSSNGLEDEGRCLVIREKGTFSGKCLHTDTDGDIRYSKLYRDSNKGNIGIITNLGGTGKWANNTESCEYNVQIRNLNVGLVYAEMVCP